MGLIFLTKPTGIIIFLFPLLFISIRLFRRNKSYIATLNELALFIISFLFNNIPLVFKHWFTIITSTINAWNKNCKYQDGLEFYSLESWLFYFKNLPAFFGILNFSFFFLNIFNRKNIWEEISKKNIQFEFKLDIWFFIYFLNCYLVISFMSTKRSHFFYAFISSFMYFLF